MGFMMFAPKGLFAGRQGARRAAASAVVAAKTKQGSAA